jgi:aspartate/methionine/tyrosine aminotransferase
MLNTRLDALPGSPFERLRELLEGVPAPVEQCVMTIGEPNHPYPEWIASGLQDNRHLWGKYPPRRGTPELLESIAGYLNRRYSLPEGMIEPARHIVPLTGSREGLFMMVQVVTPPEKNGKRPTVLIPNPFYQTYSGAAIASGADPVYVSCTAETNFMPDIDSITEEQFERASCFFLCSPANPQGTFADEKLLKRCIELARRHDFVLLLDECYAEIYNDEPPMGGLEVCAALGGSMKNVVTFHSLSKRSSAPGLRSGFVAGDPDILSVFGSFRDYASAVQPMPIMAVSTMLWNDDEHVVLNRELYRKKFALADRILGQKPGYYTPPGGFFLWLDVGDSVEVTKRLWMEQGVRVLPGAYLTQPTTGSNPGAPYIRLALVQDLDSTERALEKVARVI